MSTANSTALRDQAQTARRRKRTRRNDTKPARRLKTRGAATATQKSKHARLPRRPSAFKPRRQTQPVQPKKPKNSPELPHWSSSKRRSASSAPNEADTPEALPTRGRRRKRDRDDQRRAFVV